MISQRNKPFRRSRDMTLTASATLVVAGTLSLLVLLLPTLDQQRCIVLAQPPCDALQFRNTCFQNSSCMEFNQQCVTSCALCDVTNSLSQTCVAITAQQQQQPMVCRPKCSVMATNPAACLTSPGCFSFKQQQQQQHQCLPKCKGDNPAFSFSTQAECEQQSSTCWWRGGGAEAGCYPICSLATDPTSCTLLDPDNCEYDFIGHQCVQSCVSLRSGPKSLCEDRGRTGGRCEWIESSSPNEFGGCLAKCARATSAVDCDALSVCIFIKSENGNGGSCHLGCQYIPVASCTALNSACRVSDAGACEMFACSQISNRDFCSSGGGTCQWIDGKCVRACQIYSSFKKSAGVSCDVLFQGTPLCALDNATDSCNPAPCNSLTAAGSFTCLSQQQRCLWFASSSSSSSGGKCVDRCGSFINAAQCPVRDYCMWGNSPLSQPGDPDRCFEQCSVLTSAAACGAAAQPAGCSWRYDAARKLLRCFAAPCAVYSAASGGSWNNKAACESNFCLWTNLSSSPTPPSCSSPCSGFTDGWECTRVGGCLWNTETCTCGMPPSMLAATPEACTCSSGAGPSNQCYVNTVFSVCALPAWWAPSVACSKTAPPSPVPPATFVTLAPTTGLETTINASSNNNNSSASGDGGGIQTGVLVIIICGCVVFVAIGIFACIKYREDKQDEADLILTSAPAEGTTRKQFQNAGGLLEQPHHHHHARRSAIEERNNISVQYVEYMQFDEAAAPSGVGLI